MLVARYNVGQDNSGVIGVIGPVRMDYSRLIPHLEYFAKTLGDLLSDTMNPRARVNKERGTLKLNDKRKGNTAG